jgi:hypothetical protein
VKLKDAVELVRDAPNISTPDLKMHTDQHCSLFAHRHLLKPLTLYLQGWDEVNKEN